MGSGAIKYANMKAVSKGDQGWPWPPRRSIMMSMIIWDWLLARLLGRPVFGAEYDGQGVKNPAVG